jgi:hypothetical protein
MGEAREAGRRRGPRVRRGSLPTIANLVENGHDLSTWCRTCQRFGATIRYEDLLERLGPDFLVVHVPLFLRCRDCGTCEAEIRVSIRESRMGLSRYRPTGGERSPQADVR